MVCLNFMSALRMRIPARAICMLRFDAGVSLRVNNKVWIL